MDKTNADLIITEYMKKIYGFAISKTMNIDHAEELSSRIVFEVYTSLLKSDQIYNVNSYVYRIAQNVYSHFVVDEMSGNFVPFNEAYTLPAATQVTVQQEEDNNREETFSTLRKEISYLSQLHRDIIVMHYFQKMKLAEIANSLNLTSGTVRWHLFEARNQLKDSIEESKERIRAGNQKTFSTIHFYGLLDAHFDLSSYFPDSLFQNIAFSVYHRAKTSSEIAKELSIPLAFVEDTLYYLVENGFVDKQPAGKYLTKIYITEANKEKDKQIHETFKKYSEIVCELYIPLLLSSLSPIPYPLSPNFYFPENDQNFLLWSLITYACAKKLVVVDNQKDLAKHFVKRKYGGNNLLFAEIEENTQQTSDLNSFTKNSILKGSSKTPLEYFFLGITTETFRPSVWWHSSILNDISETFLSDQVSFYRLIQNIRDIILGNLPKDVSNVKIYERLYQEGFLASKTSRKSKSSIEKNVDENTDYFNIVMTTFSDKELTDLLPPIPKKLKKIGKELDDEMFRINKIYYPPHLQDLCRIMNQNTLKYKTFRVYILEALLKRGVLKPLKRKQRKTANMIVFTDVLPK